ncbi:unnamed protein product [Adineta ricciae]|uniref:C2H2-type domain-containing protein n=1 Tax=Adineta ricciae TaxID=249248 RepID=A0A816EQ42_ADIRI|nr:unnamed protein product [Adineta ricciae]
MITKTNKREAPDDEQSQSSFDGTEQWTEHSSAAKRIKRAPSPVPSADVYGNTSDDNSEFDDDERDSPLNSSATPSNALLTCPVCNSTYQRLGQLVRHAKRRHRIDLSHYDQAQAFETTPAIDFDRSGSEEQQTENLPSLSSTAETNSDPTATTTTTDCPYCDFKTTDIEQFKAHIIAHIRDKNYRCLLCNRLYKYRGESDCSFHIRRKHHRYNVNSNDYIQRFLFDTNDGDESLSTQVGGHGSSGNGSSNGINAIREADEPVRYFGCPYCDYTSNYGGDVRKHQARKHPNAESKVVKIIRQDSEQQNQNGSDEDDEGDSVNSPINAHQKSKGARKSDKSFIQPQSSSLSVLPNFAPVRVFQCSSCHQQGTYKWVVERHIRAKHPDQANVHVIELPAELSVRLQKISPPLKRFRCSLCPLQSKHNWVVIRHIKHFHTLQTATVVDIQPDGKSLQDEPTGDFSTKVYNQDSESSSTTSSCNENGIDLDDDDNPSSFSSANATESAASVYKCSLCDFQSNISWNIQKHLNEMHAGQSNGYMITQCRQVKLSSNDNNPAKVNSMKKLKHKNGFHGSLSPSSVIAKAKFPPAFEEAILSLQGSKLNPNLYAVQPKFGIKRLKCRHCFYRSNWKTDMIRHVRIRHNLTEPDHNKGERAFRNRLTFDGLEIGRISEVMLTACTYAELVNSDLDMIMMTEQEARSTIELYENTFGKELRRRTFRTWNDWAKAEQEFTPKDGSLQYTDIKGGQSPSDPMKTLPKKSNEQKHDGIKRTNKSAIQTDYHQESQQLIKSLLFNKSPPSIKQKTLNQLPDSSNIVSRLISTHNDDDDAPLDLSLKPSKKLENNHAEQSEEESDSNSRVNYLCSVCSYKHSNWSVVQNHISLHLSGQGLTCPLCPYVTPSETSMIRHLTSNHPTSQLATHFSVASPNLTAHILEQHQCSLCSYQCDRLEALNLHRRLEHDDEEFDIDSSDNGADDDDDLTASTTKNAFDCPLCSPSSTANNFQDLEQLTMHVITNHNNQTCPFCSFIAHTTSTQTLNQHVKLHFNGTLVQPDPIVGIEQVKELLMLE